MRADDRRDTEVLWCYTTEAHKCSVNVTVERATVYRAAEIQPDRNTEHNTHTHTHTAGCNRADMCAQHALKSHTNRQLPGTRCECVIVTLWGSVSHKRVVT